MTFFQIFPFWLWPSITIALYLLYATQGQDPRILTYIEAKDVGVYAITALLLATPINFIVFMVKGREYLIWPTGVIVCLILIATRDPHPSMNGAIYGIAFLVWGVIIRSILLALGWVFGRLRKRKQRSSVERSEAT